MTVLAAVDGEREYDRVVAVGKDLAEAHDEPLVVLHVMPNEEFAERQDKPDYYLDTAEEDARGSARRVVRETLGGFEGVEVAGEVGDVVDTIIREEDMSEEEEVDLAMSLVEGDDNIVELEGIKQNALLGNEIEPQTITAKYTGDSVAEALGKAYGTRDTIESHSDRSVTAEPTGTMWALDVAADLYEIEVTIE